MGLKCEKDGPGHSPLNALFLKVKLKLCRKKVPLCLINEGLLPPPVFIFFSIIPTPILDPASSILLLTLVMFLGIKDSICFCQFLSWRHS